jgi:hypothetical protein
MSRRAGPVLLLAVAVGPGALAAQDERPTLRTGASVAITFSRFAGTGTQNSRLQYGFGVGGFLALDLTRNIAIQPELQYVQKGSRFRTENTRSSLILGYLQVPLLLKLQIPTGGPGGISPHLYGGAAASYRIDCRLNLTTGNNSLSQPCSNLDEPPPKRWDASAIAGAGVDFGYLFVDLRFDAGLTRIGTTAGQEDIKNRTFSIVIGTEFRGPR